MDDIEVPHYFLCPISLEIMKDPVTLSTGITYDRHSIEKWIFAGKNSTCPVTKQALNTDSDLTPNHTLRRLIQSWCILNASNGVVRIPTPRPPISKAQIVKLLNQSKSPVSQMKCLQRLKSMASESEANKWLMESAGAAEFLASFITNNNNDGIPKEERFERLNACDEALGILYHLQLSEASLKSIRCQNGEFFESLTRIMKGENYESRTYAVLLMLPILNVSEPMQLASLRSELFIELVKILRDHVSEKASKAALKILISICSWGRNKIKAVEAGAIPVLIDILINSFEKRVCEMVLIVLDILCQCAEGRAELLKHGAGLAVVSKKILRVSQVGSERAVRVLYSISMFSTTPIVLREMLQVGVVAKLCLMLQVDCGSKCKEKAREILKLHARAWKNSSCLPINLKSSYPS